MASIITEFRKKERKNFLRRGENDDPIESAREISFSAQVLSGCTARPRATKPHNRAK
jgi:hypothetical protein